MNKRTNQHTFKRELYPQNIKIKEYKLENNSQIQYYKYYYFMLEGFDPSGVEPECQACAASILNLFPAENSLVINR